ITGVARRIPRAIRHPGSNKSATIGQSIPNARRVCALLLRLLAIFRLVSSCFRAIHLSSRSFLLLTLQHLFNKKICFLQVVGDLMIRGYLIMPVLMERGQTIQYGLIHIDLGPKLMSYTYAM